MISKDEALALVLERAKQLDPVDLDLESALGLTLAEDVKADADNNLLLIRVTPNKPFVYYLGAGWNRGLDFKSREDWEAYVKAQTPNFDPAK